MVQPGLCVKAGNRAHFVITMAAIVFARGVCLASDDGGFEYWATAGASLDIDKDWGCTFEEELRFKDGGGELYYHHTEFERHVKGKGFRPGDK